MNTKYFESMALSTEISSEIFREQGGVIAYFDDLDVVVKCEIRSASTLFSVIYFTHWPAESIRQQHSINYQSCRAEIWDKSCHQNIDKSSVTKRYICSNDGELEFIIEEEVDSSGDLVRETRLSNKGELTEYVEYKYDEEGELVFTREVGSQGVETITYEE
ncbi:hypothetical protein K6Y31_16480 [Motilimonas cestriensis]|uniref:Uncharacterized protein n=1 Tax=Motilimonas cestriensis TaxID=2742685 RepID=A0ABS8WBK5_9GAMM|nr:hypothetical protein [Motilimonas cestriensis]MCE2596394.1 hypothetical protein [Motilimonas cestriensis]